MGKYIEDNVLRGKLRGAFGPLKRTWGITNKIMHWGS